MTGESTTVPEWEGLSEDEALQRDAEARERLRTSLDESLIVEAAAGTGKTTVLVERLVAVLRSGRTSVDRVVAVTFTRKAAGELELRLRRSLDDAREASDDEAERARLADAIARLEEAHIGTIHSFCAEILHERPVEAGVDPDFHEMDAEEAAAVYDRAFRAWIERRLDEMPPGLRRALARLAEQRSFDGSTPLDRLREAGRALVEWRDFDAEWRREPFDRREAISRLVDRVDRLAALRRRGSSNDSLAKALEPVEHLSSWIRRSEEASRTRDFDEIEALLVNLLRPLRWKESWTGRTTHFAPDLPRAEVLAARDELMKELEDFDRRAGADLAGRLRDELSEVLELYEERKRRTGRLDFLDLLLRCRNLLRDRPDVRRDLQARFSHLFVDEFQDTDPLQAEILLLLSMDEDEDDENEDTADGDEDAADGDVDEGRGPQWRKVRPTPGKLLLVGDPKQSIYRFRRADVLLYQELKERLVDAGVGLVHLSRSFRAVHPVQEAVNAAFAPSMTEDRRAGQPAYVPLLGGPPDGPREDGSAETRAPAQPHLVALPVPEPFGWRGRVTKKAVNESLPDAIAGWVEWLVEASGWTVRDPEDPSRRVPIAPRHVCLLFRRFMSWGGDATEPYQRAFEARGMPHLLVGGRSFHQREEVESVRAALQAIEWPDDALSVYATLRGELFGLTDSVLLRYRHEVGRFDPLASRSEDAEGDLPDDLPDDLREVASALDFLSDLHRERNEIPIAETLQRLLEHTRAHAGLALRPAGNQVLANVQRIVDLARSFELRGGLSFRGFVERLEEEAERPGSSQAPVLEEGAEGVRMMTVHAAKGLEFPVVVLADLTTNPTRREPNLYVDAREKLCAQRLLGASPWELLAHSELELERDHAESVRVAYVAATRARDLLVVPALGVRRWENGWLSPLDPAIQPAEPHRPEPAPGTPEFGRSTVLVPPQDPTEMPIHPGLHRPQRGQHHVVWWDPSALRLKVRGELGVRRWRLLAPNDEAETAGLERYLDWEAEREASRERGATPSRRILAVTETERMPPGEIEIRLETLERPADRPRGRRFGTLVHTVLRDVPLDAGEDADGDEIAALCRFHGRQLEASREEIEAAAAAVRATLGHELLERARGAGRLLREAPFLLRSQGDLLIEGTVDLAFRDAGAWTVVDFKTDAGLDVLAEDVAADVTEERTAAYRRQLAWYVHAVAELTGEPAQGVLLGV